MLATTKQVSEAPGREHGDQDQWSWVDASIWTARMLAALVNGVQGGKWLSMIINAGPLLPLLNWDSTHSPSPLRMQANLDVETTDWKAVCGRTASTVWRAGRAISPTPISLA